MNGSGWIADYIFSWHMQGSGGLLTEYSVGVCRDLVDYQLNIHSMYAGVRQIINWIFIDWARWMGIEYLIVGMTGIHALEYSKVGMTGLGRSELNIQ
jgi:hypothetical protein